MNLQDLVMTIEIPEQVPDISYDERRSMSFALCHLLREMKNIFLHNLSIMVRKATGLYLTMILLSLICRGGVAVPLYSVLFSLYAPNLISILGFYISTIRN